MSGGGAGRRGAQETESEAARLRRARLRASALALQLGGTVVGALCICLGGGIFLDRRLGTMPLFLFIGLLLAFIAIGYALYELATIGTTRRARPQATGRTTPPEPAGMDDRQPD